MNNNGILWGGATASSQYEGGFDGIKGIDTQDCRPYIKRKGTATVETRLLTNEIIQESKNDDSNLYYPFRVGSRGVEHAEEDVELLSELGIDINRFSISWSRLFPNGDEKEANKKGVRYYDKIFELLEKKI